MIVLDIETTGLSPETAKITEIGAIKVGDDGQIQETFRQLIDPEVDLPNEIIKLTGITPLMLMGMPTISEALPSFVDFCEGLPIMGHNIMFDYSFLKYNAVNLGLKFEKNGIDTLRIARSVLSHLETRSLTYLCEYFKIHRNHAHRGYDDALATYELYRKMKEVYYSIDNTGLFEPKPLHYKPRKQEGITKKQEKFLKDLIARHEVKLAKPIEEYSKSEASKEIDGILNQYGRSF